MVMVENKDLKHIFFDADGTILDIKKGVPADVKDSIEKLHGMGHDVLLCTGRSRAFVPDELLELPFDGIISNMGAYIEYKGRILYDYEIALSDAKRALKILRDNGLVPVMEGNGYMYYDLDEYTTAVDWYADLITQTIGNRHKNITGNENDIHINKISAKRIAGCTPQKAVRELENIFDAIWHEGAFVGSTIEFIAKGHSKGVAIAVLTQVLGWDKSDVVVFGDSNNDLDMFVAGGTKVAMGDATDELKEMADYVTDTMWNMGITKGLCHLGFIRK